ncbi:MAG: polymer-forming cytoskeletal protein [Chlamydiae bacterium]|nr:polymer-forming cytoskeletal protein [Chlamydiota bacterium]MBI3277256.1 polymer-forming cytoskeletal protein [Chlamydiota bacterium]
MNPQNQENLLNAEVEIKGTLKFSNALRLDGKIEGQIISEGRFTLGSTGEVKGDVQVENAVIEGKIQGNVIATDKVELKAQAQLFGDIRASRLVIEEGVIFCGKSEVNPDGKRMADVVSKLGKQTLHSELVERK